MDLCYYLIFNKEAQKLRIQVNLHKVTCLKMLHFNYNCFYSVHYSGYYYLCIYSFSRKVSEGTVFMKHPYIFFTNILTLNYVAFPCTDLFSNLKKFQGLALVSSENKDEIKIDSGVVNRMKDVLIA